MKNKLKSRLLQFFTNIYGMPMVYLCPNKVRQMSEDGLTLVFGKTMNITERLMRAAILKKLEKSKDYNSLSDLHRNYWTNKGEVFFRKTEKSFKTDFLPNCAFIFEELEKELLNSQVQFDTLVEIGTGNGSVLNYLSLKFPKVKKFVGIDLSESQIKINKKLYKKQPKLEFYAEDALNWIKQHGQSNTIYVTSRGVLEYFTEQSLQLFLMELNSLGQTIFVAIEPNDLHHDFVSNPDSIVYGHERSFSHNYPKLFKTAYFNLWHLSQKPSSHSQYMRTFIGAKN